MNYFSKLKIVNCKRWASSKCSGPRRCPSGEGFTLVELIVVMTIATIIMTALVVQQSRWNDSLIVSTQAYEMALIIRQAQIYSLGVREYTAGTGDKFNIGYGIHIDKNAPTQYIFFADKNGNLKYDSGEIIETKTFTRGVIISDICSNSGGSNCGTPIFQVSISFFRPDPKANVIFLNNGGNPPGGGIAPPATISLRSVAGKISKIIVEANGQVSITP